MATGPTPTPPGLWQSSPPPGIGGGPPAGAPPAAVEGRELELQKEISSTIEAQVSRLIENARVDTEAKVKQELGALRKHLMDMDKRLDQLVVSLDGMDPAESQEAALDAEAVGQLLSKVEQQWGQEIRTLKQELHQTILAHNHNADLIKHHKDTIDALRERCAKVTGSGAKTAEIHQQLNRIDQRLKQQQKQRKLEPLFERVAVLEQRVAAATSAANRGTWPGAFPPDPMVPPGMGLPPGISQAMMPGMGMGMAGKGAGAKARPQGQAAQPKVPAKAGGEKAAAKYPTDEEVQARFNKLSTEASSAPPSEAPPPPPAGLEAPGPEGSDDQAEAGASAEGE